VRHPLKTTDFSSYLVQAMASGAKVVALANAAGDMTTATKQANEFGLVAGGQTLVSFLVFITDLHSLGLQAAQGLTFVTAFDWNRDDASRQWAKRFSPDTRRCRRRTTLPSILRPGTICARWPPPVPTRHPPSWKKCASCRSTIFSRRARGSASTAA
jgi:hypothetical protein